MFPKKLNQLNLSPPPNLQRRSLKKRSTVEGNQFQHHHYQPTTLLFSILIFKMGVILSIFMATVKTKIIYKMSCTTPDIYT